MALTSALFTGLSGLDVNQSRLSVVGNNIANANTVAFKSSRALFKPQFYITDAAGSPATADTGGSNPSQRGLGAVVATIEKDFTPGSLEPTGKSTDLAINGDGFFVVQSNQTQKFTRDGSFVLNSANQLVSSAGDFVQGFGVDASNNVIPGSLENITIPLGSATSAQATSDVRFEGNLNAAGVPATGASILESQVMQLKTGSAWTPTPPSTGPDGTTPLTELASATAPATALFNIGDTLTLAGKKGGRSLPDATFDVTAASTLSDFTAFLNQGLGIDTTAPSVPAAGATAVSAGPTVTLNITGNLGKDNALDLSGTALQNQSGTAPLVFANTPLSDPNGESIHTSFLAYDSLGTPLTVDVTAVLESKASAGNTWRFYANSGDSTDGNLALGNGTLTFDTNGQLIDSTGTTINLDRNGTGAATPLNMKLDFGQMTSLTSDRSDMVMTRQDGSPIGTLDDFSIGADGTITGSYSNGLTRTLGQVAVARFKNLRGLSDNGGNMYTSSSSSGLPVIAAPTTLGAGSIRSGALEMSNVDISKEFINMIISSTGFSASSRVISTSDQLITELLNANR